MSTVRSFEPKKRRDVIREEAKKSPSGKRIFGIFKTEKSFMITASVFALLALGGTGYALYASGVFQFEKPFTLTGPETYQREYEESIDTLIGYNPETGEFEASPKNSEEDGVSDNELLGPQSSLPQLSPEDFTFDNEYVAENGLEEVSLKSTVYRVSPNGTPRQTLEKVANILDVDGSINSTPDAYNPFLWYGKVAAGNVNYAEPYITFRIYQSIIPSRYSSESVVFWSYSSGSEVCDNPNVPNRLTQSQFNSLTDDEKTCYENKAKRGEAVPIPADEATVISKTRNIISKLGYDVEDFKIQTFPSNGAITVGADFMLEGESTPLSFEFYYMNVDTLVEAYGPDFNIVEAGDYEMEAPELAANRLNNAIYYGDFSTEVLTKYENYNFVQPPNPLALSEFGGTPITRINVQYAEGVDPSLSTTPILLGFENISVPISPTLGAQVNVNSNIWSLSLGVSLNRAQIENLMRELRESENIDFAFPVETSTNDTVSENINSSILNVTADSQVWVLFKNANGSTYISKGYTYIDSSKNLFYGAVIGLSDSVLGVR